MNPKQSIVVKQIIEEDFINYKKPSMFIGFPHCSWKCEKECGLRVCQNGALATSPNIEIGIDELVSRYLSNPITSALICGGLEPFDSWNELLSLLSSLRAYSLDDFVIYTGYTEYELKDCTSELSVFENIIVKFGRFIPNSKTRYDNLLGVNLISENQYAKKIS